LTREDFVVDAQLNSIGAALAIQSSIPYLKQSQEIASVILFSSVAARHRFSAHASISMAKAAVEGLTVSLAAELLPKNTCKLHCSIITRYTSCSVFNLLCSN